MGASTWIVIGFVVAVLPAYGYLLYTIFAQGKRKAGDAPGAVTGVARNAARRNRAAESASAIEAISKLAALADKGMLSQVDFQKKKDELLSHI